jgi:hypothetical protein
MSHERMPERVTRWYFKVLAPVDPDKSSCGIHFFKVLVQTHYPKEGIWKMNQTVGSFYLSYLVSILNFVCDYTQMKEIAVLSLRPRPCPIHSMELFHTASVSSHHSPKGILHDQRINVHTLAFSIQLVGYRMENVKTRVISYAQQFSPKGRVHDGDYTPIAVISLLNRWHEELVDRTLLIAKQ